MTDLEFAWVRGEGGQVMQLSLPLPPGFDDRIASGDLILVEGPDDTPAEPAVEDSPEPDMDPLPARGATRLVWEQYALTQGMDREKVRGMTKAQLVEKLKHGAGEG